MNETIKVNYQYTSSAYIANQWLRTLPDLIACDFEAALRYTPEELEAFTNELETSPPKSRAIALKAALDADALSHPYHVQLTHFQVAWSPGEAYVFILDNKRIHDLVLNFLITTNRKQIWHNASFDFKHIIYNTESIPQDFEDTAILAKSILNHVDIWKANVSLKELAGKWYGNWAISPDVFDVKHMYDEDVLLYSATDACATYKLWESINEYIQSTKPST